MSKPHAGGKGSDVSSSPDENVNRKILSKKPLSPEDRSRLQRLSEEIDGRLAEMRLIVGRTLGLKLDGDSVKIRTTDITELAGLVRDKPTAENKSAYDHCFCTHTNGCGCYIDPPGICIEI